MGSSTWKAVVVDVRDRDAKASAADDKRFCCLLLRFEVIQGMRVSDTVPVATAESTYLSQVAGTAAAGA